MESSLELLEEKFRRVEQASERKALDETGLSRNEPVDLLPEARKYHKKPVVSQEEQEDDGLGSPAPSPLSAAASKSTFYHTLANPRSVESFLSGNGGETQHTDEQHEIQVERIAGRQTLPKTVSALLVPRRLRRAQSQLDCSSISRGMVIDVSVETTMESSHFPPNSQKSIAYATRQRAATVGVTVLTSHGGLVERAKDFARKLRRKSRAELL